MVLIFIVLIITLSGCAHDMALIKGQENIHTSKSIALLSVKVSNQNKPSYQLEISGAFVCPQLRDCFSRKWMHKVESPYKSKKDSFNEYLLSFELDPGEYNIHAIATFYDIPILLHAEANIPLSLKYEVKPNSVVYLGHIDATLREKRSDNEERAGLLPLIDSAIVGYSSGTFDVAVEDRFDNDIKVFIAEYPALQKVKVDKFIMSRIHESQPILSHGD